MKQLLKKIIQLVSLILVGLLLLLPGVIAGFVIQTVKDGLIMGIGLVETFKEWLDSD